VEIIGGRERRRRWSMEEKLRIVRETQAAGECVRAVAARHERIEIVLPDGCRLLVGSDVSLPALRRVVVALRR
jgi:hypothetical protein